MVNSWSSLSTSCWFIESQALSQLYLCQPLIPKKVSFVWLLLWDHVLTIYHLISKGMQMPNHCSTCYHQDEPTRCDIATSMWAFLLQCFHVRCVKLASLSYLIWWWSFDGGCLSPRGKSIWRYIPFTIGWCLWKERNSQIF